MRHVIMAFLILLLLGSRVVKAEALSDNNTVAILERRHWVLKCTAPILVRAGDPVQMTVEFTNRDSQPHSVLRLGDQKTPDGRFSVAAEQDGQLFFLYPGLRREFEVTVEPKWDNIDPGQSIKSVIDITPIVKQLSTDTRALLRIGVSLDGELTLPWPNRRASGGILGLSLTILNAAEYDGILETEKKSAQKAPAQSSTLPQKQNP